MSLTESELTDPLLECQFLSQQDLPAKSFKYASALASQPLDIFHCDKRPPRIVPWPRAHESESPSRTARWAPYVDFFVRPFVVLPFQQKKIELVVVPHRSGLLRLSKLMFHLNDIFHCFAFEHGPSRFHVRGDVACLDCQLEMENKSFVFGEYKKLTVFIGNPTGQRIDKIWLINDKPLDFGHVVQELGAMEPGEERRVELAMRATINERKGQVNFLVVFESNSVLRSSLKRVNFNVANSFKTKCLLEQLDQDTFLVLIDLFDRKEHFIQETLFDVQKIILLSNVFDIDLTYNRPFRAFAKNSSCSSLIYFILRKKPSFTEVLRKNKEVFFFDNNVYLQPLSRMSLLREQSPSDAPEPVPAADPETPLTKDLLLGFLEQENRAVRREIRQNSRADLFRDYKCSQFIDFCLLWTQRVKVPESSLFGGSRKTTGKYKRINGQHSIINTAMNSVAFRIKHSIEQRLLKKFRKPLTHRKKFEFESSFQNPIYRVSLRYPRRIEHDFSQAMACTVDVQIRVTCLFKGADSFSTVHLEKTSPAPGTGQSALKDASDETQSTSRSNKWLSKLGQVGIQSPFRRPRYLDRLGSAAQSGLTAPDKQERPQLILKLSNIHQIEDSDSGSSRASSLKSSKRKDLSNSKFYPVMVWQGNRNISIQKLEENDDFVIHKRVALFSKGIYDLNHLKIKKGDRKVVNLSLHEKCYIHVT